ncbi:helix-turn-helix transcriptional regulator [Trinickia violacea]|uniref:Helix-turn-helix transcriptional regulator n=1 Tax=Trinickia violacea TaxID=2571746 RepID=A0A4P8IST3_9BURK|nr:helix-turn-helix transcriptional regulator [Trinickia violacea]QCP50815.1 helix-turn-helix transcriptional regulator [Trinickia violacea]
MDYPIKTLSQLRPILQGFRKAAGLTQAAMASQLGITQQSYAQLEANPAAASMERLFKVMRMLDVEMRLAHEDLPASKAAPAGTKNDSKQSGTAESSSSARKTPDTNRLRRGGAAPKKREDW